MAILVLEIKTAKEMRGFTGAIDGVTTNMQLVIVELKLSKISKNSTLLRLLHYPK